MARSLTRACEPDSCLLDPFVRFFLPSPAS
jgi:hypothetical protein